MIEIKMTGMCEGCLNADLELDYARVHQLNGDLGKVWAIRCEHWRACEAMAEKGKAEAET